MKDARRPVQLIKVELGLTVCNGRRHRDVETKGNWSEAGRREEVLHLKCTLRRRYHVDCQVPGSAQEDDDRFQAEHQKTRSEHLLTERPKILTNQGSNSQKEIDVGGVKIEIFPFRRESKVPFRRKSLPSKFLTQKNNNSGQHFGR